MATSREKYYTKMYETLIDYNDRNDAPFSNEKIQDVIHKVVAEEELYDNNINLDACHITADTVSQTYNKQRDNIISILKSDKLDKSDALEETLKRVDNQQRWILCIRLSERE